MNHPRRIEPADLYVHLAANGDIYLAAGDDVSRGAWVTLAKLKERVATVSSTAHVWLSEPEPSPATAAPSAVVHAAAATVREAPPIAEIQRPPVPRTPVDREVAVRAIPPPARSLWLVVGAFGIFIIAVLLLADNVRWVDIYLAGGTQIFLLALAALVARLRMRCWVEFLGSTVTIHPTVLPVRQFDLHQVVKIRTRVYSNATVYRVVTVSKQGHRRHYTVPVWAGGELLKRLSTVPGVDADKWAAADLAAWRAAAPTEVPISRRGRK